MRGLRSFERAILIFDRKTDKPLRSTNAILQFYSVIVDAAEEYKHRELTAMFGGYHVDTWLYSRQLETLKINQNIVNGLNSLGYDIRFVDMTEVEASRNTCV